MAKKLENMTTDERIAYFEEEREKKRINRRNRIDKLDINQRAAVIRVSELLGEVVETALYPDLGGIKAVTAYNLQELSDAMETLQFQFNLRGE